MFRKIALAAVAFAMNALTGAAQAAQQSCTFSSSDAKITYLFEVHSDGLEEIGSMTKDSVKVLPAADRPAGRWLTIRESASTLYRPTVTGLASATSRRWQSP